MIQTTPEGLKLTVNDGEPVAQVGAAGKSVKQQQLVLRSEQGLGFMLPVDVDQAAGDVGQQSQGGHVAVDEDPVFAGAGDGAFDKQFTVALET